MNSPRTTLAAAALALAALLVPTTPARADEPPPIFAKQTLAEAKEAVKGTDKIVVVKATAEWCGPCKMMDRTTWRDEKVVEWVEANGVAIMFDVDRQKDLAKELGIRAMPTMIAFKDGEEFDRIVGYRDAAALVDWLEGVKRGERSRDALARKADAAKDGDNAMGMQERLRMARELAQGGEHEKATEEFAWLWENMLKHEPAMVGVRGSFMASDMERLAEEHEPAKKRFTEFRDAAEARLKGEGKTWDDLSDWIVLNEVVGDGDRTLEWFDRIKDQLDSGPTLRRFGFRLEQLLEERGRWADMVGLYKDPRSKLREAHAQMKMGLAMQLPPQVQAHQEEIHEAERRSFRIKAGRLYTGLLAAGREDDAAALAAEAIKLDDSPQMRVMLVETAVEADQARATQRRWLDEAGAAGEDVKNLRENLKKAMESKG